MIENVMEIKVLNMIRDWECKGTGMGPNLPIILSQTGISYEVVIAIINSLVEQGKLIDDGGAGWLLYPPPLENFFDENSRFVPRLLGDYLLWKYKIKTLRKSGLMFIYLRGCYHPNAETYLSEEIKNIMKNDFKIRHANETIFYIKACTYVNDTDASKYLNLINMKDGIFDINTMQIYDHSPDYFLVTQIPVSYRSTADCPKFKKFLSEVMAPDDILIIQELFGYLLYREYAFAKSFMFYGSGSNGKSVTISVIKEFLGNDNCSCVSLQELETSNFCMIRMFGKMANLYADIEKKALYNSGRFKMLTGNDTIEADVKFHDAMQFKNYAKFVFSANRIPETKDDSNAFFRRWVIIKFPNRFEGKNCNPFILKDITTKEELSGIFSWAVEGLKRLLDRGEFSLSLSTQQMAELYMRLSSPVQSYVMDKIEIEPDVIITKEDLYQDFLEFCEEEGLQSVENFVFSRKLGECSKIKPVRSVKLTIEGERKKCWKGIKIKGKEHLNKKDDSKGLFKAF